MPAADARIRSGRGRHFKFRRGSHLYRSSQREISRPRHPHRYVAPRREWTGRNDVYVWYPHTNSVELNGRLTNRGKKAIRHLTGPYPLSIPLDLPLGQLPRMTTVYGGRPFDAEYPPRAYRVTETDGVYSMFGGHYDGRSTYSEMPYIVVTDADESGGLFAALEWPCNWTLDVRSEVVGGKRHVPLVFRIAGTDFTLNPGQSVPIPRACLGFFRGDAVDGSNALRRHITENIRRDNSPPPVFYNHFFGMRRDWTVEDHLYEARVYAELGRPA
jgi:hypothetical protein